MTRYVAFLRAINVGGTKLIKMDHLAEMFAAAGCRNVRTYIQSGNVVFDSGSTNARTLVRRIGRTLQQNLGYELTVVLRTLAQLETLVKDNPFADEAGDELMPFVVLLASEPRHLPPLPLISIKENLRLSQIKEGAALIMSGRKPNGSIGSPNAFVEKQLGVAATTRNWNTIRKIVDFAQLPAAGSVRKRK